MKALIGEEAGKQPVVLIVSRKPFGIYLSVRTPNFWRLRNRGRWMRRVPSVRLRISFGKRFRTQVSFSRSWFFVHERVIAGRVHVTHH